jgi:hypothetical protein
MNVLATTAVYSEEDFVPLIEGKLALPNFREEQVDVALYSILFASTSIAGCVRIAGRSGYPATARYYLDKGQAGQLMGTGLVIYSDRGVAKAARFSLCQHVKADAPNADPHRGKHFGRCKKCGVDMSYDSGD